MAVKYIYRVFSIISIYSDRVADDWCKVSAVAVAYATSVTVISDTCAIGMTLSQSAAAMTTSAASQQQQPGGSAVSDISLEFVSIPLLERRHPLYEYVRCAPQTAAVFVVPNQITGCREEAEAVTRAGSHDKTLHNDDTRLLGIFHDSPGKSVPGCRHPGFYWSKVDGGDGDNWEL